MYITRISGIVSASARTGQGTLGSVGFDQIIGFCSCDQQTEVQPEPIAGPVAVRVEGQRRIGRIVGPDIAVVVQIQVQVQPRTAGQMDYWKGGAIAATSQNSR